IPLPWLRRFGAFVGSIHPTRRARYRSKFFAFNSLLLEGLEDRVVPSPSPRLGASSLNWNDPHNWSLISGSGTFPNAQGDVAEFTGTFGAAQTVVVNQAIT